MAYLWLYLGLLLIGFASGVAIMLCMGAKIWQRLADDEHRLQAWEARKRKA